MQNNRCTYIEGGSYGSRKGPKVGLSKKTRKSRKPEKNNWKNRIEKKNRLNRLNFWKNRPVRFGFGFISKKPKKPNRTETDKKPEKKPSQTEPKPRKPSQNRKNRAKTGKTEPNRFEPVFSLKNRTETGRFDPVSVRFSKKKNSVWLFFLIKTESNQK